MERARMNTDKREASDNQRQLLMHDGLLKPGLPQDLDPSVCNLQGHVREKTS